MRSLRLAALAAIAAAGAPAPASAAAGHPAGRATGASTGYPVTFAARSCAKYTDVFANRARNNIIESLENLGPDSQYLASPTTLVKPTYEAFAPQDRCKVLPGWHFAIGPGYVTRADVGPWGSLSALTSPYATSVVTQDSTPLLDEHGLQVGSQRLAGATTVELTQAQLDQARRSNLWVQGGVPGDPVNTSDFPGPQYGFAALRCATDNVNGDNVEYVYFPTGSPTSTASATTSPPRRPPARSRSPSRCRAHPRGPTRASCSRATCRSTPTASRSATAVR